MDNNNIMAKVWEKNMKITKEDKIKMRNLKEEGKTFKEIAKIFNIAQSTVSYYLSEGQREKMLERKRRYESKLTKQQKKERQIKYKKYQRDYHREKYNTDEEFREKHKERVRISQLRKYRKNKDFRERELKRARENYKSRHS